MYIHHEINEWSHKYNTTYVKSNFCFSLLSLGLGDFVPSILRMTVHKWNILKYNGCFYYHNILFCKNRYNIP